MRQPYFPNGNKPQFNIFCYVGYNQGRIISLIAFTNSFMANCGQVVADLRERYILRMPFS